MTTPTGNTGSTDDTGDVGATGRPGDNGESTEREPLSPPSAAPTAAPTAELSAPGETVAYGAGQPDPYFAYWAPPPTAAYAPPGAYWAPPPAVAYSPAGGVGTPEPPRAERKHRARTVVAATVGAVLIAGGGVAVGATAFTHDTTAGTGTAAGALPGLPGAPGQSGQSGNAGSGSTTRQQVATDAQQAGVVDIDTVLGYQQAAAAGTGIVLSSNGEILTNNHVVFGATSIKVTLVTSGRSYPATVVGTSPTQDVAVLQLQGASGLQTANLGDSGKVSVGAQVTGVGNAGGAGGVPSAAVGQVTALNQSITASNEGGSDTQHLTGLIQTSSGIQPGDSGGPMYDTSNRVIGLNTAAEQQRGTTTASYAIPINTARSIATQIESGARSSTIHLGYPAFLGVSLSARHTSQARVTAVLSGGPAAAAGIAQGDTITAIDGHAVTTAESLKSTLANYQPNQSVTVSWTDSSGASHSASVTLVKGPAD